MLPCIGKLPVEPQGSNWLVLANGWNVSGCAMGNRRSQLEALLKEFPDDPEIYYGLAMDSINNGLVIQGIDELRSIVLKHPQFIPSYLQLGQALVREGQEDQAGDIYRAGIVVAKKVGAIQAADEMSRFLQQLS